MATKREAVEQALDIYKQAVLDNRLKHYTTTRRMERVLGFKEEKARAAVLEAAGVEDD